MRATATSAGGWFDHWLKSDERAPLGPKVAYFRDWAYTDPGASATPARHLAAVTKAYGSASGYPFSGTQPLYLSGDKTLVTSAGAVKAGSQQYANAPGGMATSYSETSALQSSIGDTPPPSDAPGTFAAWTTGPLARDVDLAGVPTLDVQLDSPAAAAAQAAGPPGRLVLFAKLYDIAPDGTVTLQHRLVSPVRVPDVTKPVHIELPGIVHRWQKGHRLQLVLAASDWAYSGNAAVLPVTVAANPLRPALLRLPVLGAGVG